jgi:putative SOS response-associated peptidase YedK
MPASEPMAAGVWRNHKTGEVSLDALRWGLIPCWCEDPTGGRKPINARCETVRTLPTLRDASPSDPG